MSKKDFTQTKLVGISIQAHEALAKMVEQDQKKGLKTNLGLVASTLILKVSGNPEPLKGIDGNGKK